MVQQYSTTRPSRVRKIPNRYKEETVVLKPCSLKPPKYIELNAHPSQKGCKQKMYNVDSIAGIKTLGGVLWHKVRWTGYSHKSDMWLKATNLSTDLGRKGLADMLAEYNSGSTVFSKAHLKSVVTVTKSGPQARKRPRMYIPPEVVSAWMAEQNAGRIRCRIRMLREREERAMKEREMQQREREEREMQERNILWLGAQFSQAINTASRDDDTEAAANDDTTRSGPRARKRTRRRIPNAVVSEYMANLDAARKRWFAHLRQKRERKTGRGDDDTTSADPLKVQMPDTEAARILAMLANPRCG